MLEQVMEPATLWFERRVRRVKRATSGKLLGPTARSQRAATIQHLSNPATTTMHALSGDLPQGAFVVFGEL